MKRVEPSYKEQFRRDVCTAEVKTDGDPYILNNPMFAPEKKTIIDPSIFGTPPKAKGKKSKTPLGSAKKPQARSKYLKLFGSKCGPQLCFFFYRVADSFVQN